MISDTLVTRVDQLERSLDKLQKDLKRCAEYPQSDFYPYFPQIVLGDKGIRLSVSEKMLTVYRNGTIVGSIVLY